MFLEEAEDYVIWNCSLCVSRDVSDYDISLNLDNLFALREQGCFQGKIMARLAQLVRSA